MPFAVAFFALKYPHYHFLFFLLVLAASLANDCFFYFGGRYGRVKLAPLFPGVFSKGRLQSAQDYFHRFGLFAFLSGRFIPFGAGNSIVTAAGLAVLPLRRFVAYTLVSCLAYALLYFYGTFLFGPALFSSTPALVIFGLLISALVASVYRSHRRKTAPVVPRMPFPKAPQGPRGDQIPHSEMAL
ncbi:VTT domain-containing protein [Myxococcota bacterium]|nr:VTT domain-containing protein [Myxococcota bacterium]